MNLLLYVWLLLSTPQPHLVCSMWLSQPPTQADMTAAGCINIPDQVDGWDVQMVNWHNGQVLCTGMASLLPDLPCTPYPLDSYFIQVIDPDRTGCQTIITLDHPGQPTQDQIDAACPPGSLDGGYTLTLDNTYSAPIPTPPAPVCPLPDLTGSDLAPLPTAKDYHLLAQNLYWWYGLTGMEASWQNRFDASIYQAGITEHVPPIVIKTMMAQESQFWPLLPQSIDQDLGEVGLGQLTDSGADLVIRYDADIYAAACAETATPDACARGYDLLTPAQRLMARNVFRRSLMVYGTLEDAAGQAASQMTVWARVLRSYYCAAGETVGGWGDRPSAERWNMTLAAYHAGPQCLAGGTVCLEGQKYLAEVNR